MNVYLNLNLKNNMIILMASTILLVYIMAVSFINKPYVSHNKTPAINKSNISKERSFADLVFHILITCGTNVMEVMVPASKPKISIDCINFNLKMEP